MTNAKTKPLDRTAGVDVPTSSRIIAAGAKLFRENGYALSTTRELSARLGINKASLYYHVSSKEELLYQICVESLKHVTAAVTLAVESSAAPAEKLHSIFHAQMRHMLGDLDLHATMMLELRSLTGERLSDVMRARDEYEDLIFAVIAEAQQAGQIRTDLTTKQLLLGMLSLLNWPIYYYKPEGALTPDELADVLWLLFLNGAKEPARTTTGKKRPLS